eukprot:Opistho-2@11203
MSFSETPMLARMPVRRAMPPGRSLTVTTKRHRRPSAAMPRSITRPSTVVSMLPPQRGTITRFPRSSGRSPAMHAARPVAPPPSTTAFSSSTRCSTASAMYFSLTVTIWSTRVLQISNALDPTQGTARPSASVDCASMVTGFPAFIAAVRLAHRSGSTPMTLTSGRSVLTARAMPARRPPPPTGTTIASKSSSCSMISSPIVPCPAMMLGWSYPLTYVRPLLSTSVMAWSLHWRMCSPNNITSAPNSRHFDTFMRGAFCGMTTVTGTLRVWPWYASASAWLPADAAITPTLLWSGVSNFNALRAPRSLKLPVCKRKSFLKYISIPVIRIIPSCDRSHGVRGMISRMRKAAVLTSSKVGSFVAWVGSGAARRLSDILLIKFLISVTASVVVCGTQKYPPCTLR